MSDPEAPPGDIHVPETTEFIVTQGTEGWIARQVTMHGYPVLGRGDTPAAAMAAAADVLERGED